MKSPVIIHTDLVMELTAEEVAKLEKNVGIHAGINNLGNKIDHKDLRGITLWNFTDRGQVEFRVYGEEPKHAAIHVYNAVRQLIGWKK